LTIWRVDDFGENLPELAHVSERLGQVVHVQTLGMKRIVRNVTAVQPVADERRVVNDLPVQTALGRDRALLVQILDEPVPFALARLLADYQESLAHLAVHLHQPDELVFGVVERQSGDAQEHLGGRRRHGYALSAEHELLVEIPFLHSQFGVLQGHPRHAAAGRSADMNAFHGEFD